MGNGQSINVLERVLPEVLSCVNLIKAPVDVWAIGMAKAKKKKSHPTDVGKFMARVRRKHLR